MAGHGSSVNSEVPAAVRTAGAAQVGWAKRHVPELASCAGRTEHGSTIHDKDSANSDLDGQVQSNCHAVCGASQCLGKSGKGGIVPHCQGELDRADASEDGEIDIAPPQVLACTNRLPWTLPGTDTATARSRGPNSRCRSASDKETS